MKKYEVEYEIVVTGSYDIFMHSDDAVYDPFECPSISELIDITYGSQIEILYIREKI